MRILFIQMVFLLGPTGNLEGLYHGVWEIESDEEGNLQSLTSLRKRVSISGTFRLSLGVPSLGVRAEERQPSGPVTENGVP